MVDRPIIFSGPMVSALLAGRKSQTRRVLKPQPVPCLSWSAPPAGTYPSDKGWSRLPYATGDRLWVREGHALVPASAYRMSEGVEQVVNPEDRDRAAIYREGFDRSTGGLRWRSPIHMPRWASRLTLTVTDVRVQRLQEISEADALAEGVPHIHEGNIGDEPYCSKCEGHGVHGAFGAGYGVAEVDCSECVTARQKFRNLWSSLHGPEAWEANPWVAAYSFTVQRGNIDAPKETSND